MLICTHHTVAVFVDKHVLVILLTEGFLSLENDPVEFNSSSDLQTASAPVSNEVVNVVGFANFTSEQTEKGRKTLLVLPSSDGTNLVKLVKCPKGGGRCSTENQFQAWVNSGLFGKSPI